MAEQNRDAPRDLPLRGVATLTGDEARVLRAFVAWLRADGVALCRDEGNSHAAQWVPIQDSGAALAAAFNNYLRDEEQEEDDEPDEGPYDPEYFVNHRRI